MRVYPQKSPQEKKRGFEHLSPLDSFMRMVAIIFVGGCLLFFIVKILFF